MFYWLHYKIYNGNHQSVLQISCYDKLDDRLLSDNMSYCFSLNLSLTRLILTDIVTIN